MKSLARGAFTLVELLVVIAIIGILVAMLLPAVQSARESARRMQCSNNIKQVALALLQFETAHGHFPHGTYNRIDDYSSGTPAPYNGKNERRCWMHDILPFIEQSNLYDAIDTYVTSNTNSIGNGGPNMMSAPKRWTVVPTLMCPSESVRAKVNTAHNGGPGPAMTPEGSQGFSGNVVVCAGNDYFNPGGAAESEKLSGIFFAVSKVGVDDIKDGTTNTLMVSEIILTADTTTENDIRGRYYNCRHGGVLFSSRLPPNSPTPDQMGWTINNLPHAPAINTTTNIFLLPRSYHTGGVNIALADGSVHSLSETIDAQVFRDMGTRAGKEVVVGIE